MQMVFAGVRAGADEGGRPRPAGGPGQVRPGVELVAGNPPIARCLRVAAGYRKSVCKSAGNRVWEVVTYDSCRKLAHSESWPEHQGGSAPGG